MPVAIVAMHQSSFNHKIHCIYRSTRPGSQNFCFQGFVGVLQIASFHAEFLFSFLATVFNDVNLESYKKKTIKLYKMCSYGR